MEKIREGERIKPSFFQRMKTTFRKEEIFTLIEEDNDRKETCNPEEIRRIATRFYIDLWKNRRRTKEHSTRKMNQPIKKIKRKVSNEKKITGERPLTIEEFITVTKQLLKNKSPGIDGIPAEFSNLRLRT